MILPTNDEGAAWAERFNRLQDQLAVTDDPRERDAILGELDELEYEAGEAYLRDSRDETEAK